VTMDGVLDWRLVLLTTYTHYSSSHLIIAPLLISTLYKSHAKSFHFALSSPVVCLVMVQTVAIPLLLCSSPL
jgi:hypothetical protein